MEKLKENWLRIKNFLSRFKFEADEYQSHEASIRIMVKSYAVCLWSFSIDALLLSFSIVDSNLYFYVSINFNIPFYKAWYFKVNYEKENRDRI